MRPLNVDRFRSVLFLVVLVSVLTSYAVTFDFVWDDGPVIVEGTVIHDTANLGALFLHRTFYATPGNAEQDRSGLQTYRPLTLATFMFDSVLYGRAPWGYHLTSLLLHLLTVLLVYALACRLLGGFEPWVPTLAAAWFAVCPFSAEACVWINGRSDLLMTLFGLLMVLARLRRTVVSEGLVASFGLASLLSKETGLAWLVTLPLLPGALPRSWRRFLLDAVAPAVAVAIYLLLRLPALGGAHLADESKLWPIVRSAPWIVVDAMSQLLVPRYTTVRWLSFELRSVSSITLAFGLLVLGATLWLAWKVRATRPTALYGFATAVICLAPVAVLAPWGWPGFGRYLYGPAAALALPVAALTAELYSHVTVGARRLMRIGGIGYIALLACLQVMTALPFASEHGLYASWISGTPDQPHGYRWLGLTYFNEGNYASAFRTLDGARRHDKVDMTVPFTQLESLQLMGQLEHGVLFADQIADDYNDTRLHVTAMVGLAKVAPARALHHAQRCLEIDPTEASCVPWSRRLSGQAQ